jgi:hypothetical protein
MKQAEHNTGSWTLITQRGAALAWHHIHSEQEI